LSGFIITAKTQTKPSGSSNPSSIGRRLKVAAGATPFAAVASKLERYGDRDEWIPFVPVDDVDAASQRAVSLGASILREKTRGPAGEFTVVRDPGGAALALWTKA
jgi:predicted enzyme related to lactoylglutathione lyase